MTKRQRRLNPEEGEEQNPRLLGQNTPVQTPDGPGRTVGVNMRRNTNGGPGVRQYVVELDDGRVRHYSTGKIGTR